MGLPWVRLDTTFFDHPKILNLVADNQHRAIVLYLSAMAYAGKHGTDGFIPREALTFLHGRKADAYNLIRANLWHTDRKGWLINDWSDYQQTQAETTDLLAKKRVASRKANCVRWHGEECECWKESA
jgi:hypothetical protein